MYYVESPKPKLDQQVGSSGVGKWVREHVFAQKEEVFLEEHPLLQMESIFGCQQMQMIFYLLIQMHITYTLKMDKKILLKVIKILVLGDYNGPLGTQGKWKGDVARSLFYMAVRYNALSLVNGNPSDISGNQILG